MLAQSLGKNRNVCYLILLHDFQHILQRKHTSVGLFISLLFFLCQLTQLKASLYFAASPVKYILTYHQCFPSTQEEKLDPVKILFAFQLMSIKVFYRQD